MEPPPEGDGKSTLDFIEEAQQAASMEPPPEGDGKSKSVTGSVCATARFNGAAARRRRKVSHLDEGIGDALKLQWSRRPKATERKISNMLSSALRHASMEPPPEGDGKLRRIQS